MQGNDTRKFAIYSRKSKFTGKGESIENQIELCKQFIKFRFPTSKDDDILVFEDEGFSGGNMNRPQFKKMMSLIESKQIKAVICYRLDRISRNVADFSAMYQKLEDLNVEFFSTSEEYNTSTPSGKAMLSMCIVFAQMERETIAERIRDNMNELAKSGRWLGGTTPTGYKSSELVTSITYEGKERRAFKLEIIPEEAKIIQLIFSKFLQLNSLTKTETYLLQNHIETKNSNKFTRFSIRAILQNPVYMAADEVAWNYFENLGMEIYSVKEKFDGKHGIMAYNKTIQKSGKTHQMRDYEEWVVTIGKHKPIVKSTDWVKVQSLLQQNTSKSYRKPKSNLALLSGLLFCANCGDYMRPKQSQRLNNQGEKIYSYLCETKEKSRCKNCNSKNLNGNTLDKAICEEIKKLSEDRAAFFQQLDQSRKFIVGNRGEYDKKLDSLRKNLKRNEKEMKSLVATLAKSDGSAAYDYITRQLNQRHDENEEIKKQITYIDNFTKSRMLSDLEFDSIRNQLQTFSDTFENMSINQKRAALRTIIKRIEWDGENVHVFLFGSQDGSTI